MIRVLGSFFLRCIRSTEANKPAVSTRRLIRMLEADVHGRFIAISRRIELIEADARGLREQVKSILSRQEAHIVSIGELMEKVDRLERKRGKRD